MFLKILFLVIISTKTESTTVTFRKTCDTVEHNTNKCLSDGKGRRCWVKLSNNNQPVMASGNVEVGSYYCNHRKTNEWTESVVSFVTREKNPKCLKRRFIKDREIIGGCAFGEYTNKEIFEKYGYVEKI